MCFFIDPKHPECLTAKNDITVYKYITITNQAFHQRNRFFKDYKPNTLYRLRRSLKKVVNSGLFNVVEQGFHSYGSLVSAENILYSDFFNVKICEFIIPKNAKYYYNSFYNEYVSTSIRTKSLVPIYTSVPPSNFGEE